MKTKALKRSAGRLSLSNFSKILIAPGAGCGLLLQSGMAQDYGINLPPAYYKNGVADSGDAAFQPGVYTWPYSNQDISNCQYYFNMIRFPINVGTADDDTAMNTLKGFIDQIPGKWAIIAMCGTYKSGDPQPHGNGKVNDYYTLSQMEWAWWNIQSYFPKSSYPNVYFEVFNEPFGYSDVSSYMSDMNALMNYAPLDRSRCILDGMGSANNIQAVANDGWTGMLAYHFYPNWVSDPTQANFSNKAQSDIGSLSTRTWVTEFGGALDENLYGYSDPTGCYNTYTDDTHPWSANVNCLRGLDDALRALKTKYGSVRGAFFWHGWDDGDSYDYWSPNNSYGACKVHEIITND